MKLLLWLATELAVDQRVNQFLLQPMKIVCYFRSSLFACLPTFLLDCWLACLPICLFMNCLCNVIHNNELLVIDIFATTFMCVFADIYLKGVCDGK